MMCKGGFMIHIYNAGPLFSQADMAQRRKEGAILNDIGKDVPDFFVANPIDLPFDFSEALTSVAIFGKDASHIDKANCFFFELATGDTGTMVEFGMAIEKFRQGKDIKIYPVFSDLRLSRNQASGVECPVGFNSFLVGACTFNKIPIHDSFESALEAFKKDFNLH
jgi:nucleoside 2-deoxyribosyltransferase